MKTHPTNNILPRSPTLPRHLNSKLDIQIPLPPRTPNRHPLSPDHQLLIMPYNPLTLFDLYTYAPSVEVDKTYSVES
jgi:hypothetical protein